MFNSKKQANNIMREKKNYLNKIYSGDENIKFSYQENKVFKDSFYKNDNYFGKIKILNTAGVLPQIAGTLIFKVLPSGKCILHNVYDTIPIR